jgi:hypothetical protein
MATSIAAMCSTAGLPDEMALGTTLLTLSIATTIVGLLTVLVRVIDSFTLVHAFVHALVHTFLTLSIAITIVGMLTVLVRVIDSFTLVHALVHALVHTLLTLSIATTIVGLLTVLVLVALLAHSLCT